MLELWTAVQTTVPVGSGRDIHETNDFAPLSGYFDVRHSSNDSFVCTLTYGFNDDSITVEGYSVLSPALAYFDASQLMIATLRKRGDLPQTHHVGPRDPMQQNMPEGYEPCAQCGAATIPDHRCVPCMARQAADPQKP